MFKYAYIKNSKVEGTHNLPYPPPKSPHSMKDFRRKPWPHGGGYGNPGAPYEYIDAEREREIVMTKNTPERSSTLPPRRLGEGDF